MIQKNDLVRFFELKSIKYDEVKVTIWQDFLKGLPVDAVKRALNALVADISAINPSVGHVVEYMNREQGSTAKMESEKAWSRVLDSAKSGGSKPINAREAKALNSMGGMAWLSASDKKDANWQRKEFMEIYASTPEQVSSDFRCTGLEAKILPVTEVKRIGD